MTAVEYLEHMWTLQGAIYKSDIDKALEMEKQEKIKILRSLVYSMCLGDDVEDVEEWLRKHELNKSKQNGNKSKLGA